MSDFKEKFNEVNDTRDSTFDYEPEDIVRNKFMSILAYFSWLVLIPMFVAKNSPFARYHCNQGLILAIAETVFAVALRILTGFFLIGWFFSIVRVIVELAFLALSVIGIINAASGRAKEIPFLGSYRIWN